MVYETLHKGVTPKVPVFWPKLFEPDDKFVPEGEYSLKVILDMESDEAQQLINLFDELTEKAYEVEMADMKPAMMKKYTAKPPYVEVEDEETGEPTGNIMFTFKMKASGENNGKKWTRACPVFDAQNPPQRITSLEGYIGNGSKGKVAYLAKSFANAKDKVVGISLKLTGFQLIDLVGGGDAAEDLGFSGEEGGYVAGSAGEPDDSSGGAESEGGDF